MFYILKHQLHIVSLQRKKIQLFCLIISCQSVPSLKGCRMSSKNICISLIIAGPKPLFFTLIVNCGESSDIFFRIERCGLTESRKCLLVAQTFQIETDKAANATIPEAIGFILKKDLQNLFYSFNFLFIVFTFNGLGLLTT